MDVAIRTYKPGEEEEIAELLRRCFDTFDRYGLSEAGWLEYTEVDPGFRRELSYVAEVDGRIVSHVQVVEKRLRTTLGIVEAAGIANVSTDPEFRRKGLASALLRRAQSSSALRSSALFTGYASGPQRIYQRLGFTDVALSRRFRAPLDDLRPPPSSGIKVVEGDVSWEVVELYEAKGEGYACWPVRSEIEWREKFSERIAVHSFFHVPREEGEFLLALDEEGVAGYYAAAPSPWDSESFLAVELVAKEARVDALAALVSELVERAKRADRRILTVEAPLTPEYWRALRGGCLRGGAGGLHG